MEGRISKCKIDEIENKNGTRLCNLAAQKYTYIVSTRQKHKKEHKITWILGRH